MRALARAGRRVEWRLFFGLWILYGLLIDDYDLESFNLQQMGVEAIVERHVFHVDGSATPQLQPGGDVFAYGGHLYAAKQPGQFMAGAVVYSLLRALGVTYSENFLLAAAFVTFFTASLASASAALCVFLLARRWSVASRSLFWPLLAALSFGAGSSAVVYSGVAHHDAIATATLTIAFFLIEGLGRNPRRGHAALAGALLGFTLTTSMLPFFMVVVAVAYFLSLRRWSLLPFLIGGGVAGLLPLLAYDFASFGNPFLPPNVVGGFSDTFFLLDWGNFRSKIAFYAAGLTAFLPVAWLGLAGLACFPRALRREQLFLVAMLLALAGYVFNIETIGGCQYGPRYLLPAMPFLALGLVGFARLRTRSRRWAAAAVVAALAFSAAVNVVGALYGAMYCDLRRYAFAHYVGAIRRGIFRHFPLALWLVVPSGVWLVNEIDVVWRRFAFRSFDDQPVTGHR